MTDSSSVRAWLAGELRPQLPPKWRIIPEQRVPDQITDTVVILKHTSIAKLEAAPLGKLENTVVATVAT
ncbi:MAG: hypothetical protein QM606_05840, partial [Leucobacter sp.]